MKIGAAVSAEINVSVREVVFRAANGKEFTLHWDRLSEANKVYAGLHGMKQRLLDTAAISRDPVTGLSATADEKLDAIRELGTWYEEGGQEWNRRGPGRVGGSELNLLVAAMMELSPKKSRDELMAWVKSKEPAARVALMQNEKVKVIVDRLRSALTNGIDSDELLGEIM